MLVEEGLGRAPQLPRGLARREQRCAGRLLGESVFGLRRGRAEFEDDASQGRTFDRQAPAPRCLDNVEQLVKLFLRFSRLTGPRLKRRHVSQLVQFRREGVHVAYAGMVLHQVPVAREIAIVKE